MITGDRESLAEAHAAYATAARRDPADAHVQKACVEAQARHAPKPTARARKWPRRRLATEAASGSALERDAGRSGLGEVEIGRTGRCAGRGGEGVRGAVPAGAAGRPEEERGGGGGEQPHHD